MKSTEKNLFIAVCCIFVMLAAFFATALIMSEPDIKQPTTGKKPANDFAAKSERLPDISPRDGFNRPEAAQPEAIFASTSSVTVNVINGRNHPRPLFCHLAKGGVDIQTIQVAEARCLFVNLSPGTYDVDLNDGATSIDRQTFTVPSERSLSLTLVANNPKTFCRDSDNGLAYDQAGITFDQYGGEFADTCISDRTLREYYCENNQLKQSDTTCDGLCVVGACK